MKIPGKIHLGTYFFKKKFKKFPDLRGLAYADDGTIIGRLSQSLRLVSELKSGFKLDGNLDFNLGKTMFLTNARYKSYT